MNAGDNTNNEPYLPNNLVRQVMEAVQQGTGTDDLRMTFDSRLDEKLNRGLI